MALRCAGRIFGAACLAWLASLPASAQFSAIESEELRLLYLSPFQNYLVPHAARCFINSMEFEHRMLGYTPDGKVTVLLSDFSDMGNASASVVPRNFLAVETAPISTAYEAVSPNERFNWLMNHELVHIATMDSASSDDRRARKVFGGKVLPNNDDPESILYFWLTTPRASAPGWYLEGAAVFIETWMAGGQGRAQGPYDEMVFRSMVRDGARIYDPLGLVAQGIKSDFQVEVNSYLYGARFMTYLGYRFGPEKVIEWISRKDGSKAYYSRNFPHVFGVPLEEVWSEWIAFEREFQNANLAEIRKYPTTPYKDVSARALGSVSRAYVDPKTRQIYVAFNYPGLVAHIGAISMDTGVVKPIVEVKGPVLFTVTSLAWDPQSRMLFYTTDNGEYRDLRSLDPATGKTKLLMKDARIGELAFDASDRSLWGIRHFNGIATLVKIPAPYTQWNQIRSFDYGDLPYDLDVSADGSMISASFGTVTGLHAVRVLKTSGLPTNEPPVATFDFGTFIPSNFVFSADGKSLYGSSYYTGVSNIFRYDFASEKTEALSNTETGFFHPTPLPDGSMVVFRYSGDGFVPAVIDPRPLEDISAIKFLGAEMVDKHPIVKDWKVGSPARIPIDDLTIYRGEYKPIKMVSSESFYPILQGYKDSIAAGMRFNFSDPVQFNKFMFNISYSPDKELAESERLHVHLQYRRYDWKVDAKWNGADFYDLFGPTKSSRKGYSLRGAYDRTLYQDRPKKLQMTVDAAYYGDLDTLPYYQNIASPAERLATAFVKFQFDNARRSLGSVDEEKGQHAQLYLSETYTPGAKCNPALAPGGECDVVTAPPAGFYPQILGTYDVGFQLPITHSSVWLRFAAGGGVGDPLNPFAQFYFGGFGNNYVDNGDIKRYRTFYSFPGLEINEVGGRTFGKAIVEWNLPPVRFLRFGSPGFYATWLRTSLFMSGLATNFDHQYESTGTPPVNTKIAQEIGNAGLQFDLRFITLSRLDTTLSFGWAAAFQEGVGPRHEAMISLKVMQ